MPRATNEDFPVVGPAEIAEMLGGISRQRVQQLSIEADFPRPLARLARGTVWRYEDVYEWAQRHGRDIYEISQRWAVAGVNATVIDAAEWSQHSETAADLSWRDAGLFQRRAIRAGDAFAEDAATALSSNAGALAARSAALRQRVFTAMDVSGRLNTVVTLRRGLRL